MSVNRYSWEPFHNPFTYEMMNIRKQENCTNKKGPSYKMPLGSKFKKQFVITHDADGYPWNSDFVITSKNFKSEVYKYLLADPKNPYIIATDKYTGRGLFRTYNLKDGTTHLYFRIKHPQEESQNRNSNESSVAVDLENNHIVEIDTQLNVTDTGLVAELDEDKIKKLYWSDYIVIKDQNNKYNVYDISKERGNFGCDGKNFKQFIDKKFNKPCVVGSVDVFGESIVCIDDGKTKFIYNQDGKLITEFACEKNVEISSETIDDVAVAFVRSKEEGKTLLIKKDKKTKELLPAKTINGCVESVEESDKFGLLFTVSKDGKNGVLDFNNNVIIPIAYDRIDIEPIVYGKMELDDNELSIDEKLFTVEIDGKKGAYIDGEQVLQPKYKSFRYLRKHKTNDGKRAFLVENEDKMCGIVDSTDNILKDFVLKKDFSLGYVDEFHVKGESELLNGVKLINQETGKAVYLTDDGSIYREEDIYLPPRKYSSPD